MNAVLNLAFLAVAVVMASACGSTKSEAVGPCPKRTEPLLGSGCAVEGTRCEYVVTATCQTDEYVCASGKWATAEMPDAAAAGCVRPPRVEDGGVDGATDAAADAGDAAAE